MELSEFYKKIYLKYSNISTDTRLIKEDCLFFALKGANFNGNSFALQALNEGAAYAIVDEQVEHENAILVDDVLVFLQKLANFHRKQIQIPFIGITGTNGKTTTKELLAATLSEKYKVVCTKGNLNNHIGVPLTILSIDKTAEVAVIEMGANHSGEIAELCEICEPNYGIITNVGKAHLEGFLTFENIIETKTALYRSISGSEGKIYVDADNDILKAKSEKQNVYYYSFDNDSSDVKGKVIRGGIVASFELKTPKGEVLIESNLFGEYNTKNMLAAATVAYDFGVSLQKIKNALENYKPLNNRSQIEKTSLGNVLVLDAYNANPTSMNAALDHFNTIEQDSKIVILGEMYELGNDKEIEHKRIQTKIKEYQIQAFFVGNWDKSNCEKASYFNNAQDLIAYLKVNKISNSLILIKGSRGVRLETVVEYLGSS